MGAIASAKCKYLILEVINASEAIGVWDSWQSSILEIAVIANEQAVFDGEAETIGEIMSE